MLRKGVFRRTDDEGGYPRTAKEVEMMAKIESTPELTNKSAPKSVQPEIRYCTSLEVEGYPDKVGQYLLCLSSSKISKLECGWCGYDLVSVNEDGSAEYAFARGESGWICRECGVLNFNPDNEAPQAATEASDKAESEPASV
jgi:hypothetical protein